MLKFEGSVNLHRVVVLNPKGGSGKTTVAFNLAGYLASTGRKVALVDMDSQGSSTRWLQNRPSKLPQIHGISAIASGPDASGDRRVVLPEDIEYAVVDAPAGLAGHELIDYTCGAHAILIPVLPSDLDIHAATRLISDLLLVAQVSRRNGRLGIVANRVKERTIAYRQLKRFLSRLSIAVISVLRDSQNYARAAGCGLCIHEMPPSRVSKDLAQWESVTTWLERCLAVPIMPRDLLRPADVVTPRGRRRLRTGVLIPAAAAVAVFGVSMWLWSAMRIPHVALPVEHTTTVDNFQPAPAEPVVEQLPDEPPMVIAGDAFKQKWRLSGTTQWDGSSILMLSDRYDHTSHRVSADANLDGWIITDAESDYAVFAQNGEEVRLVLERMWRTDPDGSTQLIGALNQETTAETRPLR